MNQMLDTGGVVGSYLAAVAARDFDTARTFLVDRGFSYSSPIGRFDDADRFIENLTAVGPILERLVTRRCMVSGDEALVVLDAVLTIRGYVTRTIAILFRVSNGHIRGIEAIFDATDYHKMFE